MFEGNRVNVFKQAWVIRVYPCLFQRICRCTRNGGPSQLQLERYVEAVKSSVAGLTYPALIGSRKQSVEDAERMFSPSLLKFMEDKGYQFEAEYIRAVLGWRQACDMRGLSQTESEPMECSSDELSLALQKLKKLALQNGFTIYDVPYDGNCMFSAISHQLQTSMYAMLTVVN